MRMSSTSQINDETPSRLYDIDKLPNLKFYRAADSITGNALKRPTIVELRAVNRKSTIPEQIKDCENIKNQPKKIVKLGWFTGVMVRDLLALFGAILFLRLPWVMGNAGIILGSIIILASGLISVLTTLSLASVATNGKVKAGGTYFLLSRTLGAEFGGPIGITMAVTDLTSAALVIVGVAVTIKDILKNEISESFFTTTNGTRVLSLMVLVLLATIILIGLDFESKIMIFMLCVLVISFANFIVGWFIMTEEKRNYGFTSISLKTAKDNLYPAYLDGQGFIKVFAVFFPAMTGILAGVNISGNLKNPQTAIPKGTLWATNVATMTYWIFGLASSFIMCRGLTSNTVSKMVTPGETIISEICSFTCTTNCSIGLRSELGMVQMSGIKYIVYAGTFAATLSSASAVLVSGPKVFQAVCRDNILPDFLKFFAVGHSQTDEPNRLYILNFLLCAVLVCIGDLNAIANLLTNFVLLGYTFINLACFYASFSKSPSWRPTFKYYNKYVALFTALLCVLIMFLVQPVFAALTLLIELILYLFVKWKNPAANWGSSSDANNYRIGFRLLKSCAMHGVHAKNFRPQCLILSGPPTSRLSLIKLVNKITKSHSLTICGNVIMNEDANLQDIQKTSLITREYFADQKIHSFYTPIINSSLRHGVRALMQCSGFGVVKPNILVMGFKKDWMLPETKLTTEYFEIIRDALDMSMGIVIARLTGPYETDSNEELIQIDEEDEADVDVIQTVYENSDDISYTQSSQHINTNEISLKISQPEQFIDIWWLFDDGGLTILFPYLLSTRKSWRDHQLRIFIPCLNDSEISYHKMAHMLNEFRIPYQSIQTITDIFDPPSPNLTEKYYKLIEPIRCSDDESGDISKICISEKEIIANKQNIDYYIKLRELLVKHSTESTLIFITMPIPRDEGVSAGLYLSWLEFISSDLPSVLFIRGNQENVLTYYT